MIVAYKSHLHLAKILKGDSMNLIFLLVLIGISANLDNLGVGIAYGVRRINIPPLSNLIIAVIAFFIGCLRFGPELLLAVFLATPRQISLGRS